MDEQKGVWRTICGRKVFIAEKQTLREAMRASGKFSKTDIATSEKESVSRKNNDDLKTSTGKIVKVKIDTKVQEQLAAAKTPKERQTIAFRYIMDKLRGKYIASDGRTVAIERIGADKMTYRDNIDKLRVCPALADLIKAGEFDHIVKGENKPNKKFEEFAYYKIRVKLNDEIYMGMLNVGIRKDGSSTLYDLRPFQKESKKKSDAPRVREPNSVGHNSVGSKSIT